MGRSFLNALFAAQCTLVAAKIVSGRRFGQMLTKQTATRTRSVHGGLYYMNKE